MTSYIISVLVVAVVLTVAELIIPSGKLKNTVTVVLSIVFLAIMIKPIANLDVENLFDLSKIEDFSEDNAVSAYVETNLKSYYEKSIIKELLLNELVAEKVNVELCNTQITKVEIYLSNLVIDENYGHINISVIESYISEKLSIDSDILTVYA